MENSGLPLSDPVSIAKILRKEVSDIFLKKWRRKLYQVSDAETGVAITV
jgi:hypothetical protein